MSVSWFDACERVQARRFPPQLLLPLTRAITAPRNVAPGAYKPRHARPLSPRYAAQLAWAAAEIAEHCDPELLHERGRFLEIVSDTLEAFSCALLATCHLPCCQMYVACCTLLRSLKRRTPMWAPALAILASRRPAANLPNA
jgi:hypothetical protein